MGLPDKSDKMSKSEQTRPLSYVCQRCGFSEYDRGPAELPSIITAMEFRREQYGWTKTKMAAELGLNVSHYSEFTNGVRRLPYSAACRAFKLGVPPVVLLQEQLSDLVATDKDPK